MHLPYLCVAEYTNFLNERINICVKMTKHGRTFSLT
jgi:hypothetical protein